MSSNLHRLLTWSVVLGLFLPVVIVIVLGLAGLLTGMGDQTGSRFCLRVAMGLGVSWASALVMTVVAAGISILERPENTASESSDRVSERNE